MSNTFRLENYVTNTDTKLCEQLIDYYNYCQFTRNFTSATMVNKVTSLNHFAKYTNLERLEDLDNNIVYDWMALQAKRGNKSRTINNRLKHMLALVHYYQEQYNMEIPNLQLYKIRKQYEESTNRRAYDRKTVYEALCYADRQTWLMIKICFDCGLRLNELRQMRLNDIKGKQLLVHGKGRKDRFVILSDEVLVRLHDYIKSYGITDYVWPCTNGRKAPTSGNYIRRRMQKAFTAAGIPDFCPHELRHSYATDLKRLGASTRSIQYGLGHSSEKITEIYLHDLDASALTELYELKYSAPAPEIR